MFPHPLGIPSEPPRPDLIGLGHRMAGEPCLGATVAGVDPALRFPLRHGQHNWMAHVSMPTTVQDLRAGGFAFRPHAMAGFSVECWVCEREYTEEIAEGPCLGDPRGREVPTRAEWRSWSVAQKQAWVDRFFA